ncbi:MAG: hypothetical protein M1829_000649 [Trizodia sp. TS-e1964]|nr:MAG: hypothetical protein M1829_000649 [Trizodia sp. TS-e1964]
MDSAEVDNETLDWNCQDYVLESLDKLSEECILDEDDEDYVEGVKKAKEKYFGPL